MSERTKGILIVQDGGGYGNIGIIASDLGGLVAVATHHPADADARDFTRAEANAAHIAKCWNAHDKLVQALREIATGKEFRAVGLQRIAEAALQSIGEKP
jgi:hypothetical protein